MQLRHKPFHRLPIRPAQPPSQIAMQSMDLVDNNVVIDAHGS